MATAFKFDELTDEQKLALIKGSDPFGFFNLLRGARTDEEMDTAVAKNKKAKGKPMGWNHYEDYEGYEGWRGAGAGYKGYTPKPPPEADPELVARVKAAFSMEDLVKACSGTPEQWFDHAKKRNPKSYYMTKDGEYIFLNNNSNILFMGHLDSVQHNRAVTDTRDKDGTICCPVLDDRLGIYTILYLMPKLGIKADLLFLDNEETGGSTAKNFAMPFGKKYNMMVEFDRKGEDVVTYGYRSAEWKSALEEFFDIGQGTFSDISALEWVGCCGVNVGVSYYKYHAADAFFKYEEYCQQMARFLAFHEKHGSKHWEHKKYTATVTHYGGGTKTIAPTYPTYAPAGREKDLDTIALLTAMVPMVDKEAKGIKPATVAELASLAFAAKSSSSAVTHNVEGLFLYSSCALQSAASKAGIETLEDLYEKSPKAPDFDVEMLKADRGNLFVPTPHGICQAAPGLVHSTYGAGAAFGYSVYDNAYLLTRLNYVSTGPSGEKINYHGIVVSNDMQNAKIVVLWEVGAKFGDPVYWASEWGRIQGADVESALLKVLDKNKDTPLAGA